jgi:hypothetical protein
MFSRRSLFAALGLAIPLAAASTAEAAKKTGSGSRSGKSGKSASKPKKSGKQARAPGKRQPKG